MKMVTLICTVRAGALLHLPGGYKVWGGKSVEVPESFLEQEGIKRYLKSGRLKLSDQSSIIVPSVDKVPEASAPEKVEVVDMVEEGPDAVLMGAINDDGTFVPKEEVETTTRKPRKKKEAAPAPDTVEGASSEEEPKAE